MRSPGELPTLAGIATGTPDGGVAIIRISGTRAQEIAARLVGSLPTPRHVGLRELDGEAILVVSMPGPHSFTGEDVVELHTHAGTRNVTHVLERLLATGASAAGPGDFSRRAFEHGRLTLDRLEGIAALIGARTQAALDQAKRLVAGELGREAEALGVSLGQLRVEIEAHLDFPEDVGVDERLRWTAELEAVRAALERWLSGFAAGARARERIRVALAGPPNAGKSALFNALLGRRRALVSEQAGTTRDYVEAELELAGYEITLIDTAGLRRTDDPLEQEGVELGREQMLGAELTIWVEAANTPERLDWQHERATIGEVLLVENKIDLGRTRPTWLGVSALEPASLEPLRRGVGDRIATSGEAWIGLARHRDRASEALAALVEVLELLSGEGELELVAFGLALAQRRVGEITGQSGLGPVGADVLDAIFSRFCIGK